MRGLRTRLQLTGLVAAIVLPFAAASVWIAWRQYQAQDEALGQALLSVSRSLSAAADRELASGLALLQALAHSPYLDDGRLAEFHALAVKVAATRRDAWMLLIEPSGQIVAHSRLPFGTKLPNSFALETRAAAESADEPARSGARWVREVFETRAPVYTDLFQGPVLGSFVVAAGVPVLREGRVLYCLVIVMPAGAFQPLVEGRPRLEGSGALLYDSRGFIIARADRAQELVGRRIPQGSSAVVQVSTASLGRDASPPGQHVLRAATRSPLSGWTAAVTLSEEAAFGAIWRPLAESIALAALILAASIALALGMASSMTRRRLAEEESRAKDGFLAALGHELRNPLSAIASSAELLRHAPDGPLGPEALARILRQVAHMRRLLDDLLDATRAIHGKLAIHPRALALRDCAEQVVRDHARRLGAATRISLAGEAAWVRADPARLHQMIDNLVDNAVKYGARNVTLHTRASDGVGVLTVADDGQGIAPELMQRLFQPFVQGRQSLERAQGGLGLGLALVRRLAELHGGAIEAESAGSGRGSRFTLRLPAADPAPPAAARAEAPSAKKRVLVVEDLADARDSLCRLLEAEGHEVATAVDGVQGLGMLRSLRPDVALVDIGLPGMTGLELAQAVRADADRAVTLIALTGYGLDEDRRAALSAGFDAHLTKPVSLAELRQALGLIRRVQS